MIKKLISFYLMATVLLLLSESDLLAQAQTRVRFRRGSTSATISGKLTGFAKRTFVVRAKAGQDLTADLTSENTGVRFGNNGTSLNYATEAGDNYVYIINDGRAATTFTLTISVR